MIEFLITRAELQRALKELDEAAERGFKHSVSIFGLAKVGPGLNDCQAVYTDGMLLKSHPTNPNRDWGRARKGEHKWYRCVRGRCREVDDDGKLLPEK